MRMQRFVLMMVVMVFLLVGCWQQAATPPAPTNVPTEEPTGGSVPTVALVPTEEPTGGSVPTVALVPTEEPTGVPVPTVALVPTEEPTGVPVPTVVPMLTATGVLPLGVYRVMILGIYNDYWDDAYDAAVAERYDEAATEYRDADEILRRLHPPEQAHDWHQQMLQASACLVAVYAVYEVEFRQPPDARDYERLEQSTQQHENCRQMVPEFDTLMAMDRTPVPTRNLSYPTVQAWMDAGTPLPLDMYQGFMEAHVQDWRAALDARANEDHAKAALIMRTMHSILQSYLPPESLADWHAELLQATGCFADVYTVWEEEYSRTEQDLARLREATERQGECREMIPDMDVLWSVALVPTEEPTGGSVPTVALVPTEHLPLPTVQAMEAQGTPSVDYMMGILEQGTPMPLWYYQSMIHKTIMDWEAGLAAFDDYDFHLTAQVFQDTHKMITRHNPPEEFSAWHQEFVDYSGCLTGVYTAYAEELPKPEYEIDVDRLDEIVARHQECQDMIPDFDVVMDR